MFETLLVAFLIGCGGFAMAAFAATDRPNSRDSWRQLAWFVAVVAALVNVGVQLFFYGRQGYNVIGRDFISVALLAIGVTFIVAGLNSYPLARAYGPTFRATCSVFVALLLSILAPVVVALVHCTSGDCL